MQSEEELCGGKLINISEKSGYDEKDEDVSEEVTPAKKFLLKELMDMFHDIEKAMDEMLEADPDLERSMTIWPRHKNDTPYCKLYNGGWGREACDFSLVITVNIIDLTYVKIHKY